MNLPTLIVDIDTIAVHPDPEHEWTLPTSDVARGFAVSDEAIRSQKLRRPEDLVEGKHWVVAVCNTPGGTQSLTHWTRRGIIRLGFFLRGERARLFRDAAEDLILRQATPAPAGAIAELVRDEVSRQLAPRSHRALPAAPLPSAAVVAICAGLPPVALRLYARLAALPGRQLVTCPHHGRSHFGQMIRALAEARLIAVERPGAWTRKAYHVTPLAIAEPAAARAAAPTVANLRYDLGLSQRTLAQLLGVSRSTVQRHEADDDPSLYALILRLLSLLKDADHHAYTEFVARLERNRPEDGLA